MKTPGTEVYATPLGHGPFSKLALPPLHMGKHFQAHHFASLESWPRSFS